MIIPINIHPSWKGFLTEEILNMLNNIEAQIGTNYNPTPDKVLRFLTTDLNNVKVIIIGQDVYPAPGVATGRAFEVGSLTDWYKPFKQVSLKNIVRLIYKNYNNISDYSKIKSYSYIKTEMKTGKFPILAPNKLFDSLENQGVLFLNSSFTCEVNNAGSHVKIWHDFFLKLIEYICSQKNETKWFLWGSNAQQFEQYISPGTIYKSRHPMMCSTKYKDDFLKSDCFKNTMDMINWLG